MVAAYDFIRNYNLIINYTYGGKKTNQDSADGRSRIRNYT